MRKPKTSTRPNELPEHPARRHQRGRGPLDAADEPSTFACTLDGQALAALSSPLALTAAEGPHTLTITAIGAAGNREVEPASHTWKVDLTPPDTTLSGGPAAMGADFVQSH